MALMKKLTSATVASSLILGLVAGSASADWSALNIQKAAERMRSLGIVKGVDASGDLGLNTPLTRAQLVTIIVRAFGQEENAKLLNGAPAFTDTADHWASGVIAMAKNMIEKKGLTMGVTATTFNPDGDVTTAEAVAFTMKFLGIAPTADLSWPNNYLQGAVDAGILSSEDMVAMSAIANTKANRGLAFYLADRSFSSFKLPDSGKSMYQTYVDTSAPTVTVDSYTASTDAESIELTGTVFGQSVLHVSSRQSAEDVIKPELNGKWKATVPLKVGENNIWVHAVDVVGNAATPATPVKITRVPGAIASIEVSDITVEAGKTADVMVTVKDDKGNVIEGATLTAEAGEIGTYAAGKFTAGTKTGEGTLTLTAGEVTATAKVTVKAGALASLNVTTDPAVTNVSVGTPLKLTVTGADAHGNAVDVAGKVTYTATNGVVDANGNFAATVAGSSKVTAMVGEISKDLTITVFSSASKLAVSSVKSIVRNSSSNDTVTVTVQDANGFTVGNYTGNVTLTVVAGTADIGINTTGTTYAATHTVAAVNGVATFKVKSTADGTANMTARLQATSGTLTGALKDVSLVKPALSKFEASVDVNQIEANPAAGATVTVKAYDQEGVNSVAGAAYTLSFSSGDTSVLTITGATNNVLDVAFAANTKSMTFPVRATSVPGSSNLTATVKDSTATTVSIPVNTLAVNTAIATAAAKLQVIGGDLTFTATDATAQSFKVAVLDQAGNVLTSNTGIAAITVKDSTGAASTKWTVTAPANAGALVNGIGTYTIVPAAGAASDNNAGTYTIEASLNSLTKATGTITVNPGAASTATSTLTADNSEIAADGVSKVVLTATIRDAKSNAVAYTGNVTLKRSAGTALTLPSTMTVAAVNGVATWTLTAGSAIGSDTLAIESDVNGDGTVDAITDGETVATALTGLATKVTVTSVQVGKVAGETYTVTVKVQDGQGTPKTVTSDNGRAVSLVISDGTGTLESTSATTVNGVATFKLSSTKANTVTFHAESSGLTNSADATAAFAAAAPAKIVLTAETANIQAGADVKVTASYVDAYGNTAAGTPDIKTIALSGSAGTIVATEGSGVAVTDADTGVFWINAATFPASGTLTAVHDNASPVSVDPLAITVYNAGLAYRAQVQTVADVTASANTPAFSIKVNVVDYNGVTLSNQENADVAQVPFILQVKNAAGTVIEADLVATSYVNGVATYSWTNNADGNAGAYTFAVVARSDAALQAAPFSIADATTRGIWTGIKTTSAVGNILHGSAASVQTAVINSADGTDITGNTALSSDVSFAKVMILDARSNLVSSFNGTGKLTLTGTTNLSMIGADSNGVLAVNITNGFGTAQLQRSNSSTYGGTLTGSAILSGTTYTADGTALVIANP